MGQLMFAPLDILMRIARRGTMLLMVLIGCLWAISASPAEAGVMLPWVDEVFAIDRPGAEGAAPCPLDGTHGRDPLPVDGDDENQGPVVADVLETGGGASSPVSSSSGPGSLLVAVGAQLTSAAPLLTCQSRRLRERSLQLPQPPCEELLDPPKN